MQSFTNAVTGAVKVQPRVFISYSSEDVEAALDLGDRLLGAGYGVWLDKWCLMPGQDWEYEIHMAVADADILIFLVSQSSAGKIGFIQRELRLALDAADERPEGQIFLIPVRLDDAPIPLRIRRWQWIDMRAPDWFTRTRFSIETAERRVVASVRASSANGVGAVDVLGVDLKPTVASPHDRLTLDYVLRLAGEGALVQLGASFLSVEGYEYFDQAGDRRLHLRPGTAAYRRPLRLPGDITPGIHRLVVAVWLENIGNRPLAVADCGELLNVVNDPPYAG